jgi:DNA helicase HerA-like ATPase
MSVAESAACSKMQAYRIGVYGEVINPADRPVNNLESVSKQERSARKKQYCTQNKLGSANKALHRLRFDDLFNSSHHVIPPSNMSAGAPTLIIFLHSVFALRQA